LAQGLAAGGGGEGVAAVERSLIQERTKESVEHRRKTGGNLGGRPKTSNKKERLVIRLREEGESYRSIRDQTGLSLATIWDYPDSVDRCQGYTDVSVRVLMACCS